MSNYQYDMSMSFTFGDRVVEEQLVKELMKCIRISSFDKYQKANFDMLKFLLGKEA